jgi:hypothetical protein
MPPPTHPYDSIPPSIHPYGSIIPTNKMFRLQKEMWRFILNPTEEIYESLVNMAKKSGYDEKKLHEQLGLRLDSKVGGMRQLAMIHSDLDMEDMPEEIRGTVIKYLKYASRCQRRLNVLTERGMKGYIDEFGGQEPAKQP